MRQFIFHKTEGRYSKHCIVCGKLHKRGYRVEWVTPCVTKPMENFYWNMSGFVCSKKCQNMYMLQNI